MPRPNQITLEKSTGRNHWRAELLSIEAKNSISSTLRAPISLLDFLFLQFTISRDLRADLYHNLAILPGRVHQLSPEVPRGPCDMPGLGALTHIHRNTEKFWKISKDQYGDPAVCIPTTWLSRMLMGGIASHKITSCRIPSCSKPSCCSYPGGSLNMHKT